MILETLALLKPWFGIYVVNQEITIQTLYKPYRALMNKQLHKADKQYGSEHRRHEFL